MSSDRLSGHTRHFLGWDSPLIDRAIEFLTETFSADDLFGGIDLSTVDLVLPTTRGVRRIRRRLAEINAIDETPGGSPSQGPRIFTVGELAERLYTPPQTIATTFEQTLAWAQALRDSSPEQLAPLMPTIPPPEPLGPWVEFGTIVRRLHEDLAAAGLALSDVESEVETESERARWRLLANLADQYLQRLSQSDRCDPHDARRNAIAKKQCRAHRTIVLIGTTDLSATQHEMLSLLKTPIHVLIAAPPESKAGFDQYGSVDRDWWADSKIPIDHSCLISAGDITDQADAVAEAIESFQKTGAERWTIGTTDESQIGPVEFSMRSRGETTYRYSGYRLDRTSVSHLLRQTGEYLERRTWDSLASLVRHPDLLPRIAAELKTDEDDLIGGLDALLATHFPVRTADPLPPEANERFAKIAKLPKTVDKFLKSIRKPKLSLAQRCEALAKWIEDIYDDEPEIHPRTQLALGLTLEMLDGYARLPAGLDVTMTLTAVIETLLDQMGGQRVLTEHVPEATEMLGWLDLALDDAPAMVVVGFNHPYVPGATTNDPFLPGSLRTRLRVSDNERRFARDAHTLRCIVSNRPNVRLIVGKNSADGSPTPPSRLLAAAESDEVAARIRHLMKPRDESNSVVHPWLGTSPSTMIAPAKIDPTDGIYPHRPIETMSVTAFKEYLTCPYRFYLRRVLRLSPLDDSADELAANQFGDLVHNALEIFGKSKHKDEINPGKIEDAMLDAIDQVAEAAYGKHVSPAVHLQVGQAKRRIRFVARAQAVRIAEGWVIHEAEASVDESKASITVDGRRMGLRGRFDRIDHHPDTGRWAILDYKTHGHKPEKKHLEKDADGNLVWVDLQLPLYRRMIPFLNIDTDIQNVQLGYFNIADKESDTKINVADFSEPLFEQADQLIEQVVRDIFAEKFDPVDPPPMYDDFGIVLQTGIAAGMLATAGTGGDV